MCQATLDSHPDPAPGTAPVTAGFISASRYEEVGSSLQVLSTSFSSQHAAGSTPQVRGMLVSSCDCALRRALAVCLRSTPPVLPSHPCTHAHTQAIILFKQLPVKYVLQCTATLHNSHRTAMSCATGFAQCTRSAAAAQHHRGVQSPRQGSSTAAGGADNSNRSTTAWHS
jgi:hypothetical protein